ncbi:hypothetical protein OG488_33280 [Streptomyces sp. NBC_01460]|uniref:hypothetical protein n=1 Tax=Streptomyces sp. NBC_01460 TaxID=2903875 RepID=UPI002E351AB9|nr:hypothetical protein [Streptomyces sp. NBC_01460]
MTEYPGFGALLARLLHHRELDAEVPAERAGSAADEIRAVLAGQAPEEELLRRLAPAVGLHALDLFILAGGAVPDDVAPVDAAAEQWVGHMVIDGVHLPAAGRRELLRLIRSLPKAEPSSPFAPRLLAQPADGPGAWIIRMLQYRNLSRTGMAHLLAVVTPTCPSAATYGAVGAGRKSLTPRLVTDFAGLLGMDPGELAALTAVVLPGVPRPPAPEVQDAAALLWEARRLSAAQACHVSGLARSMRGDSDAGYRLNLPAF